MNTPEMHVMFRQFAQQMGMQNVRAILPEQIDLLLNSSQMDVINQIIKTNVGVTNDRIITDNSKIGQINALRSLYHVYNIDMCPVAKQDEETRAFNFSAADRNTGRMTTDFKRINNNVTIPDYMFLVDFSLNYKKVKNQLGYTGKNGIAITGSYSVLTPSAAVNNTTEYSHQNVFITDEVTVNAFVISLHSSIDLTFVPDTSDVSNPRLKCTTENYTSFYLGAEPIDKIISGGQQQRYTLTKTFNDGTSTVNNGIVYNPLVIHSNIRQSEYIAPTFDTDSIETNYFPVRIIDDAYLADSLNDFILKNRLRSPIIVTYNNMNDTNVFDLYIDKFKKVGTPDSPRYVLDGDLVPYKLRMSYIAKPKNIYYGEDIGKENQDCQLPEYMHEDLVKHAVDLYRATISGALMGSQTQDQGARQEDMRNNYRNDGNVQQ